MLILIRMDERTMLELEVGVSGGMWCGGCIGRRGKGICISCRMGSAAQRAISDGFWMKQRMVGLGLAYQDVVEIPPPVLDGDTLFADDLLLLLLPLSLAFLERTLDLPDQFDPFEEPDPFVPILELLLLLQSLDLRELVRQVRQLAFGRGDQCLGHVFLEGFVESPASQFHCRSTIRITKTVRPGGHSLWKAACCNFECQL